MIVRKLADNDSHIPWPGIFAATGAAVFYTCANIFLRKLSTETDYLVVVFIKALTTAAIFVPWLFLISKKIDHVLPHGKYFWIMIFAAIQVQIFGNCGQQIAFGVIGMAVGVPIYIGSLVASSAFLGFLFLKENVSTSVAISLGVLVVSVMLLSCGGDAACDTVRKEQTLDLANVSFVVGVFAAIGTGIAYAVLGVCIRYVLRSGVPTQSPIVFVSLTGTIGFGLAVLFRDGLEGLQEHEPSSWLMMICAGVCNAAAFFCLSKSLKLLPVVYVNAINVSQVAMAAAVGVLVFCEPLSVWLTTGLVLMIFGFVLLAHFSSKLQSKQSTAVTD